MKIKEFKSKIFTWLYEPKWLNRLALYSSLGAAVIISLHFIFSYFGFLHTDVDSARYMLSALVQSEAAIVALVVTLSLVAVQLAAQSYSARVIEVFRRTPDLWILMGIYGAAIFYGLGVLKMIERANPQVNSLANLEGHVSFAYYLGVFAFVALVPYMWNTLEMLKPSTVINMLAEGITRKKILSAIGEGQEKTYEEDPIQPIIDIVYGSLTKYDYTTVRDGLEVIRDHADRILKNETIAKMNKEEIAYDIFFYFTRIGKLSASIQDESSTVEVINNLRKIGMVAAKQKLESTTQEAVWSLRYIGVAAAEQKLEIATRKAAEALGNVGKFAAEQGLKGEEFWGATFWAAEALEGVGIAIVGQKLKTAALQIASSLNHIGVAAAEQKLEIATRKAAEALGKVGKFAAEQKLEKETKQIVKSLEEVLNIAREQKLDSVVVQSEESLKKVNEALSKIEKE